ncbi:MAG: 2-dehydropantoate 2-reductase [Proteobacteria bacterium]|nr:2-dehydropantoate 2-reductase [Pseudomonadota bacterium]MBU2227767.1 2-dehydropantoate 2-reductase [Pseudomonadota bacterium]MBU2260986.1 2-dehydropantoate 2-reductase [Pseudomonadota bacterium]
MKIAVVGIGGMGGYFGGKIALKYAGKQEHRVIFIARGEHLAAIRRDGLWLKTVEGEYRAVPDLATDSPGEAGACDLVLFCVKEYDLEAAAAGLFPLLHDKTVVLPVLNGVDIAERLRSLLPRGEVLSGCVYISTFIEAPGVVRQVGGTCQLFFGPDDGNAEAHRPLEKLLKEAGIKAELSSEIAVPLWTKYLFVSPMAGVTSLTAKSFGEVMADEKQRGMVRGLMEEIAALARAKGVRLPSDSVESGLATIARFPHATKSSMQLDFEKGKRTEVDLFIGYAVRAGRALSVPTPLHDELYAALTGKPS